MDAHRRAKSDDLQTFGEFLDQLNEADRAWVIARLGVPPVVPAPAPQCLAADLAAQHARTVLIPSGRAARLRTQFAHLAAMMARPHAIYLASVGLAAGCALSFLAFVVLAPGEPTASVDAPPPGLARRLGELRGRSALQLEDATALGPIERTHRMAGEAVPPSDTTWRDARAVSASQAIATRHLPMLQMADTIEADAGLSARFDIALSGRPDWPSGAAVLIRGVPEHVALHPAKPLQESLWRVDPSALRDLRIVRYAITTRDAPILVELIAEDGSVIAAGATRLVAPGPGSIAAGERLGRAEAKPELRPEAGVPAADTPSVVATAGQRRAPRRRASSMPPIERRAGHRGGTAVGRGAARPLYGTGATAATAPSAAAGQMVRPQQRAAGAAASLTRRLPAAGLGMPERR